MPSGSRTPSPPSLPARTPPSLRALSFPRSLPRRPQILPPPCALSPAPFLCCPSLPPQTLAINPQIQSINHQSICSRTSFVSRPLRAVTTPRLSPVPAAPAAGSKMAMQPLPHCGTEMNPLRLLSSSSKRCRAGQGTGAPAALSAQFASVSGTSAAPTDGSTLAPTALAATSSPPLLSLQSVDFPTWWTSSSPKGSNTRYVYFELGRVISLCKNSSPSEF
jgi:hypothetical protein